MFFTLLGLTSFLQDEDKIKKKGEKNDPVVFLVGAVSGMLLQKHASPGTVQL